MLASIRAYSTSHRRRLVEVVAIAVLLLISLGTRVVAQASTPGVTPLNVGGVTVSGSLRTRLESWDWFGGTANGTYMYPGSLIRIGLGQVQKKRDWQAEFSLPLLFDLPEQPIGAGPAGLGANYFVANDRSRNAACVFVKQAFFRFKDLGGIEGQSLKVGRMEFLDGAEVSPKNTTLAALKRDRVAARLLANFGFTHVQRSVDGAQYAMDRPMVNLTLLAARPTRGVFQVDGWGELDINVFYGAITRQFGASADVGEWRLFGLAYNDDRGGVVKTDNRPLADRQADRQHVTVQTFGGHYILAVDSPRGPIDVLLWGAAQTGSWGELAHRAGSFAAEAGWQPNAALAPWVRGGFDYASGDGDPNDSAHGTFFQVLPTPRLYARFPFFNLMNSADTFVEVVLRPTKRVTTRTDVHALRLADGSDLWYQGGGAFQPTTFGYVGQPVNGRRDLATLYDVSADVVLTTRMSVTGYYGFAAGGAASATNYPTSNHAALGYAELLVRF
jgi:hypothetical protein